MAVWVAKFHYNKPHSETSRDSLSYEYKSLLVQGEYVCMRTGIWLYMKFLGYIVNTSGSLKKLALIKHYVCISYDYYYLLHVKYKSWIRLT